MSATVIIGGQYGSEGKGKVAAYLAPEYDWAAKSGGPNSGHTVFDGDIEYKLRTIPSAFVNRECSLAIAPAALLSIEHLQKEIKLCAITENRLHVDPRALVITERYTNMEKSLVEQIGSTGQGVGAALLDKLSRKVPVCFAKDVPELSPYISDVPHELYKALSGGEKLLIEGSQGYGLSINHGVHPFVTSRDTTAATMCGDLGVGLLSVDEVIVVLRTFPIRVGGNSGPLKSEIDWKSVTHRSGWPSPIEEFTTVTNRLRRVGEFDIDMVTEACRYNSASSIALNFIDYVDYRNFGLTKFELLTSSAREFVDNLEETLNIQVSLIGTGPKNEHIIDRRNK